MNVIHEDSTEIEILRYIRKAQQNYRAGRVKTSIRMVRNYFDNYLNVYELPGSEYDNPEFQACFELFEAAEGITDEKSAIKKYQEKISEATDLEEVQRIQVTNRFEALDEVGTCIQGLKHTYEDKLSIKRSH